MSPKKKYVRLTVLCTAVYFTSHISRINLATVMVELIQSGFAPKQVAALALTLCSITYGVGQILSNWMGDRFKPQNIILLGYTLTASMNLSVSFLQSPSALPALWAVNGFAQAYMWAPGVIFTLGAIISILLFVFMNRSILITALLWLCWLAVCMVSILCSSACPPGSSVDSVMCF